MTTYDINDAQLKLKDSPKLGSFIAMSLLKANNSTIEAAYRIPEKWYAASVVAIIATIMWKAS